MKKNPVRDLITDTNPHKQKKKKERKQSKEKQSFETQNLWRLKTLPTRLLLKILLIAWSV
jgi:hypothetical protein